MSQTTHSANDHGRHASIVKGKRGSFVKNIIFFAESSDEPGGKGAFEMHHLFLCYFSLVHISKFSNANFSSIVRISSKASVTAVNI